jgi:hypothetical protein
MESQESMNHLVIPDSHGEYDKVSRIVDAYENTVDRFVFLGDVIDGRDVKPLIGLIQGLGERAITIVGNHEWVLLNALQDDPEELVAHWRHRLWSRYERDTLASYGIARTRKWEINAKALSEVIRPNGHYDWLAGLPTFYETDSFVAIHAGPRHDLSWDIQKKELDDANTEEQRMYTEPLQIFDHGLSKVQDLPSDVDSKLFISGHSHLPASAENRRAMGRVCLGSRTRAGDPFFTWESQKDEIKAHIFS